MTPTLPASPEDNFPTHPPRRMTPGPLALAALEAGVSPDDVLAHLESRGGPVDDEIARLALELLGA